MYEKQIWEDRQVEYPMTFTVTENLNGTVTLTPYPGAVSNEGTKFTAARMNNIENGISNGSVPTGCILPFGGEIAPEGWLLCDGSAIDRTTYADLFSVLGTTYGVGDNTSTFNLPDMRGKVPVGLNTKGVFDTLGKSTGEETHKLTISEMPSHSHALAIAGGTDAGRIDRVDLADYDYGRWYSHVKETGGSQAHNNIQPSLVFNYIIKT